MGGSPFYYASRHGLPIDDEGVNDFINESFNPNEKQPVPQKESVNKDSNPEIFYS